MENRKAAIWSKLLKQHGVYIWLQQHAELNEGKPVQLAGSIHHFRHFEKIWNI
jgi:hypothetical protein